ncbi:TetR/AcrR family transcriptional regulator [Nocardioides sp. Soil796]|uniref:TetR/AcrR family transcriptional regulator n=1 Tax=Nocardioides sp. Soil796 TaxID=1736412 RepID=UPI0009EB1F10|nr:TetR/AcrR family transcriptional regulator [Nocardioides sp. Soil796]
MATKDDLVDAGVRLLERDGLAELTLRTIAREAGVSHGAPRRHFPTYAALLGAVARRGVDDLDALLAPALKRARGATGVRNAAQAYVDFAMQRPDMFELITRHDLLEGAGGELRGVTASWFDSLRAAMSRVSGREVEPVDALSLWAGVHGVAVLFSRRAVEAAAPGATSGADDPAPALARLVDALVPAAGAR